MPRGETVICGWALFAPDGAVTGVIVGRQSAQVAVGICVADTAPNPAERATASIRGFISCP
jgi:hypothetical protein